MKRINVLFVMAWLCLILNELDAQQFPSTYFQNEVHFAMDEGRMFRYFLTSTNQMQIITW